MQNSYLFNILSTNLHLLTYTDYISTLCLVQKRLLGLFICFLVVEWSFLCSVISTSHLSANLTLCSIWANHLRFHVFLFIVCPDVSLSFEWFRFFICSKSSSLSLYIVHSFFCRVMFFICILTHVESIF